MKHALLTVLAAAACLFAFSPARAQEKSKDASNAKPIRVLLVAGGCCHDYAKQKEILKDGISKRANVEFTIVHEGDGTTDHVHSIYKNPDWAKNYDVVIHDECAADVKDLNVINTILAPHKAGLPAVVLHCGMHCYRSEGWPDKNTPWFEFTGLPTTGHGAQRPIDVVYTDTASPITKGLENWTTINEELYNNIKGDVLPTAKALATGAQGQDKTIVAWTNDYNGTKVFATTLGHNNETVGDDKYLDFVTRGLLWATGHLTDEGKPAEGYGAKGN